MAEVAGRGVSQRRKVPPLDEGRSLRADDLRRWESEFVAAMSHEMRTPLHVIVGYDDLLLRETYGVLTQDQRSALERIGRSARQLVTLIDATLEMCRFEVGRGPLDAAPVDVLELIAEVRNETQDMTVQPGVCCEWCVEPGLPPLRTDRLKLKVVLTNLVTNALKFTTQGVISVDVRVRTGGVAITVSDTGVGISADDLAVIFEPFRQAVGSATRACSGVGLGLYVVRSFVELLGGTIDVTSRVGIGSTFRVFIPIEPKTTRFGTSPASASNV